MATMLLRYYKCKELQFGQQWAESMPRQSSGLNARQLENLPFFSIYYLNLGPIWKQAVWKWYLLSQPKSLYGSRFWCYNSPLKENIYFNRQYNSFHSFLPDIACKLSHLVQDWSFWNGKSRVPSFWSVAHIFNIFNLNVRWENVILLNKSQNHISELSRWYQEAEFTKPPLCT